MFNQTFYYTVETVNTIIETGIIALFYHRIFRRKYNLPKYNLPAVYVGGYIAAFIILLVSTLIIPSPYVRIYVTFGVLILVVFLLYKGGTSAKLFATTYMMLIFVVSETLFAGILTLLGYGNPSELLETNTGRVLGMVGTKIFDFWIVVYTCRIYKNKVKSLPVRYWVLILLMPFLSAVILAQIFPTEGSSSNVMLAYIFSVCGILYLNFSVFNYFESYDKQIELAALEQIMERENENYRALADSYEGIRGIKHDLKNQLSVLNDLIKRGKYDEAKEYMSGLYSDVEKVTSVCFTDNPALDSIINLKGDHARSLGITYLTKIKVGQISADMVGLCSIMGNAIDNAIEACERFEGDEKHIMVSLAQTDGKLIIDVENTSQPVDVENLTTSKENKIIHGIGLQSIRRTVERMGGYMSLGYSDGCFSVKIVFEGDEEYEDSNM